MQELTDLIDHILAVQSQIDRSALEDELWKLVSLAMEVQYAVSMKGWYRGTR